MHDLFAFSVKFKSVRTYLNDVNAVDIFRRFFWFFFKGNFGDGMVTGGKDTSFCLRVSQRMAK